MSTIDWTDCFRRKEIADTAQHMIDEIIREIYLKKLTIHTAYDLKLDEIGKLYRWPLYVGINTFVERLVRVLNDKDRGLERCYHAESIKPVYYINIAAAAAAYYNDVSLNVKLLNDITSVLSDDNLKHSVINVRYNNGKINNKFYRKKYIIKSGIRFLKRKFIYVYLSWFNNYQRSTFAYEESNWLNLVFPIKARLIEFPYKKLPENLQLRENIKECCRNVFLTYFSINNWQSDNKKMNKLSNLFECWIDHVLPLSLIEGLPARLNYYVKMLRKWEIRQVHTAVGYNYNDNIKCFSILAKRKNAKIFCHDHGVNNFFKYFHDGNEGDSQYKGFNMIYFCDYYIPWGSSDKIPGDTWYNVQKVDDIKIINNGSVYLSRLKKWKKSKINPKKITLLYPSGPLRTFMANLQEITPEKNLIHRKNVLEILKNLLDQNFNLKILYKTFMGIDLSNDPIIEILSEYFDQGRMELASVSPIELLPEVDIAFFDMISTGFAEAIQIGVPTMVFANKFDYELASDEGKNINDKLEECGIVFYEKESGLRSFEKIMNDLPSFQKASMKPIRQFQEAVSYPVSKNEFKQSLESKISCSNS